VFVEAVPPSVGPPAAATPPAPMTPPVPVTPAMPLVFPVLVATWPATPSLATTAASLTILSPACDELQPRPRTAQIIGNPNTIDSFSKMLLVIGTPWKVKSHVPVWKGQQWAKLFCFVSWRCPKLRVDDRMTAVSNVMQAVIRAPCCDSVKAKRRIKRLVVVVTAAAAAVMVTMAAVLAFVVAAVVPVAVRITADQPAGSVRL